MTRVTLFFKGGSQTERDNHRPISVLPCISKVYESFANNDLQRFATDNGLISDHQFAYARYSSTTVALIIAVDSWKLTIDKGETVVCTFLDLRKAFDGIEHATLISKLTKRGVRGKIGQCKQYNMLTGRSVLKRRALNCFNHHFIVSPSLRHICSSWLTICCNILNSFNISIFLNLIV